MKTGCGHGPNECDPRNPECVADIIATQRREIERLKDALARKLADVLREEIFRPCIERAFGTPVVVGRYDMTTPCPHVWANARTGPDGSDEVSCARCGARPAGGAPSH